MYNMTNCCNLHTLSEVAFRLSQEKKTGLTTEENSQEYDESSGEASLFDSHDYKSNKTSDDETSSQSSENAIAPECVELANSLLSLKCLSPYGNPKTLSQAKYTKSFGELDNSKKFRIKLVKQRSMFIKFKADGQLVQGRPTSPLMMVRFVYYNSIKELDQHLNRSIIKCSQFESQSHRSIQRSIPGSVQVLIDDEILSKPSWLEDLGNSFKVRSFNFVRIDKNETDLKFNVKLLELPEEGINVKWIKKEICSPRYKRNMKLYLVGSGFNSNTTN